MFFFNCATCGTPTRIVEVHGWIYGAAFCQESCAAAGRASGRFTESRTAPEVLKQTLEELLETGNRVRASWDKASRAESNLGLHAGLTSTPAVLAFGVAGLGRRRGDSRGAASPGGTRRAGRAPPRSRRRGAPPRRRDSRR